MTKRTLFTTILCAAFILCVAGEASAYRWNKCRRNRLHWDHSPVRFRVSEVSLAPGGPYAVALQEAADRWNKSPSDFRYNLTCGERRVGTRSRQNEIWFSSTISAPAVTKYRRRRVSCRFKEVDIIFRTTGGYTTSRNRDMLWPYGGGFRPFQSTALHEFGHAQGLKHSRENYSVMGIDWTHVHTNGSTSTSYAGVMRSTDRSTPTGSIPRTRAKTWLRCTGAGSVQPDLATAATRAPGCSAARRSSRRSPPTSCRPGSGSESR